jgi:hypothetical protein
MCLKPVFANGGEPAFSKSQTAVQTDAGLLHQTSIPPGSREEATIRAEQVSWLDPRLLVEVYSLLLPGLTSSPSGTSAFLPQICPSFPTLDLVLHLGIWLLLVLWGNAYSLQGGGSDHQGVASP